VKALGIRILVLGILCELEEQIAAQVHLLTIFAPLLIIITDIYYFRGILIVTLSNFF
jgi:hypothetical protein